MKVCIVGATAYTSVELIKLLVRHPEAEIVHLGGRREGEPPVSELFPSLARICDLKVGGLEPEDLAEEPDVAFFTLPHGVSQQFVPRYLEKGIRCIDFSADYRFDDPATYRRWYGEHSDAGNLERAVYGIPELFAEAIAPAGLLANPGCYPTAFILPVAPLIRGSLVDASEIIVDAKSGVSGRGNKPDPGSMFCECNEDVRAYKVGVHRHEPEMERAVRLAGAAQAQVYFVPHLVPMDRGIFATIYVRLRKAMSAEELNGVMEDSYASSAFVRVKAAGASPRTKDVAFTNYCDMAVASARGDRAVLTAAIDNLMKGASSQAVQSMNIMFGLPETTGLL